MRRFQWMLAFVVLSLLAACASGGGGWGNAPRNDPAACVSYCQNAYQRCNANPSGYGDCGEANRSNQCDKITSPELRGACQTSQAFCQNRSAASVCAERLNSCMASCN